MMEEGDGNGSSGRKASSLRWAILRQALLRRSCPNSAGERKSEKGIEHISRKPNSGFNLIPCNLMDFQNISLNQSSLPSSSSSSSSSASAAAAAACFCYTLPIPHSPPLYIFQRVGDDSVLKDFEICNTYDIDNAGIVCSWPSEEVLAYYCLSHADLFRSKKVIELGSGYGLAGLVIAMATEASEVVISDGNPQVVDYIQRNIDANYNAFGAKQVKSLILHWKQHGISKISNTFDIIVASDCTFFKEFHKDLATTLKWLLKKEGPSTAIFFCPKRGDTLNEFLVEVKECGWHFSVDEIYDAEIWRRHLGYIKGDDSWPNYDEDHCYPLLIKISW